MPYYPLPLANLLDALKQVRRWLIGVHSKLS